MNTSKYISLIEHRIHGIPCLIGVIDVDCKSPDYNTWDSDIDYYGYFEASYEILDRKGYKAAWLERKVTANDESDIDAVIYTYFMEKSDE